MPKVGKKHFAYTPKGKKAAKTYAKKTGQAMKTKPKLGSGARFKALAKKVGSPALAAFIGRKKFGAKKFAKLAAAGRKK